MSAVADHSFPPAAVDPVEAACFHCGLPLARTSYRVEIGGVARDTCCRGCQAVAQTIVDNGLESYYRHRAAPAGRPAPEPDLPDRLKLYDLPEVQHSFVRAAAPHEREAALLLDGIVCAACVWLIEQRIAALEGVRAVDINYATRRARVRWDERRTRLSAILHAVAALGYGAQPYDVARSDSARRAERRTLLWRLFVAGFGMMQVMMYAVPAYIADGDMTADVEQLMRLASLLLTAPVMLWSALPFYAGAWRDLKAARVGMDVPITLGILAASLVSIHATFTAGGETYFDSVAMFVFLLLGARYLELTARTRAAESQERLARLVPAVAERLDRHPAPTGCEQVPVALLRPGDHVVLRPGAIVPADGTVVEGESAADESQLTGEARPVAKRPGDALVGGAANLHGPLTMRVERVGEETVLSGIVRLVDRAQTEKPAIALLADAAARWFVAALLVLAAATGMAWYAIDPARAPWIVVALLVVTCPCALSLATPTALAAATDALQRCGVLVTRGHALETLANATHFVFDKTGTLTRGGMALIGVMPLSAEGRERCLELAAGLESCSEHPIGRAIVAAAAESAARTASGLRAVTGRGVEGRIEGRRLRIGTPAFVAGLNGAPLPQELLFASDEVTAVALGDESGFIALFTLGDALRGEARAAVQELQGLGKTTCVLSGDRRASVEHVARELGIRIARGAAAPHEKLEFVRALQRRGGVVAMIGDGVNDAPVLAQAQVSIALGSGTRLAQVSADMVLMSGRLDALLAAVRIAREARRVIRQNLAWATAYNAIAVPLAVLGHVTPLVAAIGMSVSSLTVVANALRLARLAPAARPDRHAAAGGIAWSGRG
ncbi:MAG: cadmium-translocating P-type ATPase [Betaproteobacteria bacterium]|nr:cadmium-translocating P-type ATPase [Betaproteobacteria bacterium]